MGPRTTQTERQSNQGACCFNHTIGLPKRDNVDKPLFDSLLVPDSYHPWGYTFKHKHLWVKATELGVTEFMLRLMAWLCLCNDDYRNSQMYIVTAPNQDIAIKFIKRMKGLFESKFIAKIT